MFKLYPQQQIITNQLINAFNQPNLYTLNSFYLSGEPGSGKTYMGSAIAAQYLKTHQVLLVSPQQVIPKWMDILTQACGKDVGIQYLKRTQVSNFNQDCPITILDPRSFYTFANDDNPIIFNKPVLFIYDEIHTLSGKGYDSLKALLKQIFVNHNSHALYLTGTIFSQNVADLARLMVITHPHLADPTTLTHYKGDCWFSYTNPNESEAIKRFTDLYGSHLPRFVHDIWQYCSVSIAIEDVKAKTSDDFVEQTIAPITPLKLNREQQLFSTVIESQLNAAGFSHEKAQMIVSDSLDYPSSMTVSRRSQSFKSNNLGVSRTTRLANGLYTSIPLMPIPFEQTSKMQALLKLLSESGDDHILIYCSNPIIIQELVKVLKAHKYDCLDASIYPPFEIAQQMNEAWEAGVKICVVDPSKVTTGVDLYAEQCVWYQLLPNVADVIQAQRRIRRLSSTTNSVVTYLLYENTYQEELANQLSNVSKFNAATYGVKQTDPLAQLTGVLLGELDS